MSIACTKRSISCSIMIESFRGCLQTRPRSITNTTIGLRATGRKKVRDFGAIGCFVGSQNPRRQDRTVLSESYGVDADHDELNWLRESVSAHVPIQKTIGASPITNSAKCTILQRVDRRPSCTKSRQTRMNENPED